MLKDEELLTIDNESLLLEYHNAKITMSGYNAAEGSWKSESTSRNLARNYMRKIGDEVHERNLTPLEGEYLL